VTNVTDAPIRAILHMNKSNRIIVGKGKNIYILNYSQKNVIQALST